ncbi:MAG: Rho termination factor N-terminal domain-containing protein [Cellulosilyticaceae bacterium]
MIQCKALGRISTRQNGVLITFNPNDIFEISNEEAKRLEKLNVATLLGEIEGEVDEDQVVDYLSQEELEKKNKEALAQYATNIGIDLNTTMKKEEMIYSILDYIEELKDEPAKL